MQNNPIFSFAILTLHFKNYSSILNFLSLDLLDPNLTRHPFDEQWDLNLNIAPPITSFMYDQHYPLTDHPDSEATNGNQNSRYRTNGLAITPGCGANATLDAVTNHSVATNVDENSQPITKRSETIV